MFLQTNQVRALRSPDSISCRRLLGALCVVKAMEAEYPKVVCDRCGELVYKRAITLENLSKYDLSNKENWVASVMNIEGVTKEVALSWANHGLYEMCNPKIAYCSSCGAQL